VPVELRAVEQGDGPALHHVVSHPDVWRRLVEHGRTTAITALECDAWALRDAAHWRAHGFGKWLVLEDGLAVGRGGLTITIVEGRPEVELGWVVAREHWGRGIATQIAADGLDRASELGLEGIIALVRPDNVRSVHVARKIGLRPDGELVHHGGHPHVLYRKPRDA
jgi:RimJ/RimL family protein N-acetyltransferase